MQKKLTSPNLVTMIGSSNCLEVRVFFCRENLHLHHIIWKKKKAIKWKNVYITLFCFCHQVGTPKMGKSRCLLTHCDMLYCIRDLWHLNDWVVEARWFEQDPRSLNPQWWSNIVVASWIRVDGSHLLERAKQHKSQKGDVAITTDFMIFLVLIFL